MYKITVNFKYHDPFQLVDVQGYACILECLLIAFANSKRAGQGRSHPNNETVKKLETPGANVMAS